MATLNRFLTVDVLCILFGIGSWVTVNGVWVELPELVRNLPEFWTLPSYLSVIIQLANIGPLTYSFISFVAPTTSTDVISVSVTTAIGATACLLLSFFWNRTVYFVGQQRSLPLLVLVFFMALVDCTSSVLFVPFMASYKEKYLTSYLVGEGLSGFLPSILSFVQGVGGNPQCKNVTNSTSNETVLEPFYPKPRFSTSNFFIILFILDSMSLIAFFLLNFLPQFKGERVVSQVSGPDLEYEAVATIQLSQEGKSTTQGESAESIRLSKKMKYYFLILQAWLCALSNGVFTSILSYSALPYGNTIFHLSVSLSTIANPLGCCIAFFAPTKNVHKINSIVVVGTLISCYLMATAVLSPNPPLVNKFSGEFIIVSSWILFSGLYAYAKLCVASVLRGEGRKALFWYGVWTQIGSALGATVMFLLINVFKLFVSFYPCA